MNTSHTEYLQLALSLARKRKGFCAPNPSVGVVVVKDNHVIATGYHHSAGEAHAEADAFKQLSLEASVGSTVYVTLEPCCHQGKKTPPCTELLIERRIKTLYFAFTDPNPLVMGQGKQQLLDAGIECIHLPLSEIDAFYQSYLHWTNTGLPWVTAKLAMSLDGKIAGPHGERTNITGDTAQVFTHQYRKQSDAILTTARSTINDDPQLNIRLPGEAVEKKTVYVLDKNLEFPMEARLFQTAKKIILFHAEHADEKRKLALEAKGVHCVPIALEGNHIDITAALIQIGKDGVHDLLLEAGGKCFESFMLKKQVQRAFIYVALKWLGPDMQSAFQHTTIFNHAQNIKWHALGEDAVCEFSPGS